MKKAIWIILVMLLLFSNFGVIKRSLIYKTADIKPANTENTEEKGFSNDDFLKVSGTKIVKNVNGKEEEVILRGYNLGLWISKSYWGLPINADNNEDPINRYSPVNSIQMDYELFTNKELQEKYKKSKNSTGKDKFEGTYEEFITELNNLFYSNWITETDLETLKNTGINLVRVPLEWTFFMRPEYDESKIVECTCTENCFSNENNNSCVCTCGYKHGVDYNNYGAFSYVDTTNSDNTKDINFLDSRLNILTDFVTKCKTRKIYIIFDLHVAPGGLNTGGYRTEPLFFEKNNDGLARRQCALRIWKLISDKFKNEPTVAGYDILNEPEFYQVSNTYINVLDFYDNVYKAIRNEVNDKHIIIMEGKVKSYSNSTTPISDEIDYGKLPHPINNKYGYRWDTNVVYSKHDYFYNFNNDKEDQWKTQEYQKDNPDIEIMKARIDKSIKDTIYMREEYNIPIWIGEFSCHAYYNKIDEDGKKVIWGTFKDEIVDEEGKTKEIRYPINEEKTKEIWNYQMDAYEKNNISYTAWTYKACWERYFGLVYYGRSTEIPERINLNTASYDQVYKVFSSDSEYIMNYNTIFHNIFREQLLEIFGEGVDISAQGNGSVIAKLSNNGKDLIISGTGNMIDTWTTSENAPWYNYRKEIKNVKLEEGVTNIGRLAFYECVELVNVEITNSITKIGHSAFFKCSSLKSIEIKGNLTSIGNDAFYRCSSLEKIYVYASNSNYTADNGVLYNKQKTKIIKYPEGKQGVKYTVASNVTSIQDHAFSGTSLTTIIIPKDVIEIGVDIFKENNDLTIICKEGSTIETYAQENEINSKIDDNGPKIDLSINGTTGPVKEINSTIMVEDELAGANEDSLKYLWSMQSENITKEQIVNSFKNGETLNIKDVTGTYYLWIYAKDNLGNESVVRSEAFIIDNTVPIAQVSYSKADKTNPNIRVTITTNEEIQEISGWTLSTDKKVLTKEYTQNTTEIITIKDISGNETAVEINVTQVAKIFNVDTYEVKENYIVDINPKTTYENFTKDIETNSEFKVKEDGQNVTGKTLIKTGQKLAIGNQTFTLVVIGDTNGDGQANIKDILSINKHRLNKAQLVNEYLQAGDINEDGKVNLRDILQINKYRLGKISEL